MNSGGVCVWTESIWWYSLWPKVKYCFTIPPASTLTFTYCGQHPNHQPGCPTFNKAETSSDVNYVRSGLNVILKSWPRNSNWVVSTSFAPGRSPRLARHQLVRLFPPFLQSARFLNFPWIRKAVCRFPEPDGNTHLTCVCLRVRWMNRRVILTGGRVETEQPWTDARSYLTLVRNSHKGDGVGTGARSSGLVYIPLFFFFFFFFFRPPST